MESQTGVDAILDALYVQRGLDFRLYRRSTIERRLRHRMTAVHAADYDAYLDVLTKDPAEFDHLVAHLTLKVSGFFRNPPVFALLQSTVLPALLAGRERLSVWSAGCASGEEPYSVAIILEDLLADAQRRPEIVIVGSDLDPVALENASAGRYHEAALADLPPALRDRWFTREAGRVGLTHVLRPEIRERVGFVWHNLVDASEPPPGAGPDGFDLVLCRNVLIYFERPLQQQVIGLLHRSLRPGGYLVLGEAESLAGQVEAQYRCLDRRARVYAKRSPSPGGNSHS